MVNPLMCAKLEPMTGVELEASSSSFVKLEQDVMGDHHGSGDKPNIKMEVLEDLFGMNNIFGNVVNSVLPIETDQKDSLIGGDMLLGLNPSGYPSDPSLSPTCSSLVRRIPESSPVYPPVLSIPGGYSGGLTSPTGLHISISPALQGERVDTTTLTSPNSNHSSNHSLHNIKKTVFTAKAQIEIIPCKVCGDKSSGVHYGVITCEGCKGFFRRSQSSVTNYQCPRQKNCVVDRVNRNRCQFCRLQKCMALGMSRDAVKFGRMSKKQREKVEEEVTYHQNQSRLRASDQSPDPWQGPDSTASTDSLYGQGGGVGGSGQGFQPYTDLGQQYATNQWLQQSQAVTQGQQFDEYVDSTTPNTIVESRNITDTDTSNLQTGGLKVTNLGQTTSLPHRPQHQIRLPQQGTMTVIKQEQGVDPVSGPLIVTTNSGDYHGMEGVDTRLDQDMTSVDSTTSQTTSSLHEERNLKVFDYINETSCPCPIDPDPEKITHEMNCPKVRQLMSESIYEAHQRTCPHTKDQIQVAQLQGVDQEKLFQFKNMTTEDLWLTAAEKLNGVITQIIEFAKMVPCFLKLPQDDQIVLLKAGSFELAILRMSRYYDLSANAVLFVDHHPPNGQRQGEDQQWSCMLPMEAFMSTGDNTEEWKLVSQIFDFAKSIAELHLSEFALSLYSAYILYGEDRAGLKNLTQIIDVKNRVWSALQMELLRNNSLQQIKGDMSTLNLLMNKKHTLRELSRTHLEVLSSFKRKCVSNMVNKFPPLYWELHSTEAS